MPFPVAYTCMCIVYDDRVSAWCSILTHSFITVQTHTQTHTYTHTEVPQEPSITDILPNFSKDVMQVRPTYSKPLKHSVVMIKVVVQS